MPARGRRTNDREPGRLHINWRLVIFTLVLGALLTTVLSFPFLPSAVGPEFRSGFPAPSSVKSPVTTRYASEILTAADREAAAESVPDVYRFDSGITVEKRQVLSDTLRIVAATLADPRLKEEDRKQRLGALSEANFTTETLDLIVTLDSNTWAPMQREALRLYDSVTYDPLSPGEVAQISADEAQTIRDGLIRRVQPTFSTPKRTVISGIVGAYIAPNYVVDQAETESRREAAQARTPTHYVEILQGELIVYEGQIVQKLDLEKMEAAGLRNPIVSWWEIAGHAALVFGLLTTYSFYLGFFHDKVGQSTRELLLIGSVMLVAVLAARLLVPGRVGVAYAFPLATAAILLTLLLNWQVAVGADIVLAVLYGSIAGSSLELTTMALVGGLVGILGLWKAQRSSAFLFTGFYLTLANWAIVGGSHLITHNLDSTGLLTAAVACAINGFFSVALSFATFGFLGTLFGQITVLQLMELSNPNHPLLHRLMQEAPGTYYHSIIVGNLAERAAEVIGADPLLVRVGAYFHDIGKIIRPYFFVDNQSGRTNIHDELPPISSARIITDHVRDGVVMARKYRLPEKVAQFIPQHHGTTTATYFYRRALQEDETVNPDDFRYPGPKPQSREAAILMLADSVEATVRSMTQSGKMRDMLEGSKNGEDPLTKLVAGIVDERVRDGQLDECDLTFRDLKAIQQALVEMLRGVYHPRVLYPEFGKVQVEESPTQG